jgi:hypothetical protein
MLLDLVVGAVCIVFAIVIARMIDQFINGKTGLWFLSFVCGVYGFVRWIGIFINMKEVFHLTDSWGVSLLQVIVAMVCALFVMRLARGR